MNNLVGQEFYNNYGEKAIVIEHDGYAHITIKSTNGYIRNVSFQKLKEKNWKTPYALTNRNKGYIGEGKYSSKINDIKTPEYLAWNGMLDRCYCDHSKKHKAYVGCSVCDEWLNFQNFAEWYNDNLWNCDERIAVDKDILHKGNKIYTPENCIIVPAKINSIFTKSEAIRGEYYIGVEPRDNNKFRGVFNIQTMERYKRKYSKFFDTPEEAFYWYKEAKEQYIKDVANLYKSKYPEFPQKLYDAMYAYEVEITD